MKRAQKEFLNKSRDFIKRYFFLFAGIILMILSFIILKSFLVALISSFVLAYLIMPLQKKLSTHMHKKIAALISVGVIILAILVPLFLLIFSLIKQINNASHITPVVNSNILLLDSYFPNLKENVINLILNFLKSALYQLPSILLSIGIMIIATYYLLVDWDSLIKKIELITPFKDKKRIRNEVSAITNNIVYGYIFIAILEFIVATIGFYISGVKLFLILPALIAILAFIPGLGPGAIWLPTSAYYFLTQNYFAGVGVLITGIMISIVIETLLLPKIVEGKSKIHPLVFLLGVIGGVPVFGIFGFIIGPLVLVYSIKLIEESLNKKD